MKKHLANPKQIAVFDISSNSVAGGHILVSEKKEAHKKLSVLASSRIYSEPKESLDIARYINNITQLLEKNISILKKADNHKPEYIQVLLASPWFVSQGRTISYSKSSPFTCSQKLIDSLIDKEVSFIIQNEMGKFGNMGKDSIIIEKQISQIRLNGYSTSKPFGKKIKNLELYLVITVSPKFIIDKLKTELLKNYASANIKFTTSPYATFVVARDFLNAQNEIMLIDIGEEITDIACVKDGLFLYQHSFPVGTYNLYRELCQTGKTTISEANALLESFRLGKLSSQIQEGLNKSLKDFGDKWQRSLSELVDTEKTNIKIPESLYISCDPRFSSFFIKVLQEDAFIKHATGSTSIKPTNISYDMLSSDVSSLDQGDIDATIVIAGLFSSRML